MVIKETLIFTQLIQDLISDENYAELQKFLVENPESGDVMTGTRGLRKIRWKISGKGKRGGIRVIYYILDKNEQIYMIFAYKKNNQSKLTAKQIKQLKEVVKEELENE